MEQTLILHWLITDPTYGMGEGPWVPRNGPAVRVSIPPSSLMPIHEVLEVRKSFSMDPPLIYATLPFF